MHKGFVCVLKGLVILLCHFWDVMVDELGSTACVCIFNVCGVVCLVKLGCLYLCMCLDIQGLWCVCSGRWERLSVYIWKQTGCVGLCVQELWSVYILGLWNYVWVFWGVDHETTVELFLTVCVSVGYSL